MEKCCNWLFFVIDYADIFRFPLTLSLNQKEKTSTYTGKVITVLIICYILYSSIVSDMVNKTNADTLIQDLIQTSRPYMTLSKENFSMAIGIANVNNNFYSDETIFSLSAIIYHRNNNDNSVNQSTIQLQLCTENDFIENPSDFDSLGLNGTFCLPDEAIQVGGYWDEETIDYFYIQLTTCQNSTDSPIICQSQEDINAYLQNNYIDIYLTDNYIDASNYLSPISSNLRLYYQQIDPNLVKSLNLDMMNSKIETNDGFFFDSIHLLDTSRNGDLAYDTALLEGSNCLYYFTIYSSNLQTEVTRNYQKIQTLIAQLGGICNFIFLLGFFVSKIENHYQLITLMSNELNIFPKITPKKKENLTHARVSDLVSASIVKKNPKTKKSNYLKSPRENSEPLQQVSGRKVINVALSKFYEKPNTDRGHVFTTEKEDPDPEFASKTMITPHKIPSVPEISKLQNKQIGTKKTH